MFEKIIGQDRPKDILQRALKNDRVPHAYLFSGPDGVGKEAMAIELAKAMYCAQDTRPCNECSNCHRIGQFEHPDVHFIFPAPKSASIDDERQILDSIAQNPYNRKKPWAAPHISIDKIRELRRVSAMKPMEGQRIVIISDADSMNVQAANSLLKILEEPPPSMHLILVTSRINALLQTIISRCQEIRFSALSDSEIANALVASEQIDPHKAEIISRISQGSYSRAIEWLDESFDQRREMAIRLLRASLRKPSYQFDIIAELLDNFDKKMIRDILGLILIWFRDSLIYINSHDDMAESYLVNLDKIDILDKFVNTFEYIDIQKIIQRIEYSIQLIDRNAQLNLVLYVLLNYIQDNFRIKR